jgi:hypothetical protein
MRLKPFSPSVLEKTQTTLELLFSWLANDIGPEELQPVNIQAVEALHGDTQDTSNTKPH